MNKFSFESLTKDLLNFKAWGDQELMICLSDQQASLPPEALTKAIRLMNHIHVVDQIFLAHLQGRTHGFTATNTKETPSAEALRWQMGETNQRLLAEAEPSGNTGRIPFRFTDGDAGAMTRDEMLLHVCLHSSYHRGQVGQMLKDHGIAPPRELLTRKLHTDEPARPQTMGMTASEALIDLPPLCDDDAQALGQTMATLDNLPPLDEPFDLTPSPDKHSKSARLKA